MDRRSSENRWVPSMDIGWPRSVPVATRVHGVQESVGITFGSMDGSPRHHPAHSARTTTATRSSWGRPWQARRVIRPPAAANTVRANGTAMICPRAMPTAYPTAIALKMVTGGHQAGSGPTDFPSTGAGLAVFERRRDRRAVFFRRYAGDYPRDRCLRVVGSSSTIRPK
jgi:hypothetical protein